jgi:phosphohistidine phosphatase SixA
MKFLLTTILVVATVVVVTVQAGCSSMRAIEPSAGGHKPLVVFLVRHAEKADHSQDPELSAAGRERAELLAKSLRSANIEFVHSSNFIRTRETATPTANEFGLDVTIYDPYSLNVFAEQLRQLGGRHLVVGHSNTTPAMVKLLGGNSGIAINEEGEFDRLYRVTIDNEGRVSTVLLRYGKQYYPD